MPRHPKTTTPLRSFREILGESQKTFGQKMHELTGLAPETYKAYEQGTRKLNSTAAVRLMIIYGVDPKSIMAKSGQPRDITGRLYSKNSFENWPGERVYDTEWLIRVIQRVTDRLIRMLLAARRAQRFTLALHILDESLGIMQGELQLKAHYNAIAGGEMPFKKWDPFQLYTAGGLIRQPEQAEFPLAETALHAMKDLISKKGICCGTDQDAFIRKEQAFLHKDRP